MSKKIFNIIGKEIKLSCSKVDDNIIKQHRLKYQILNNNFDRLVDDFNNNKGDYQFKKSDQEIENIKFEIYTKLANYIFSLRSYHNYLNEKLSSLIDRKNLLSVIQGRSKYEKGSAFLIGLRHHIQYGSFECIEIKKTKKSIRVLFNESKYKNSTAVKKKPEKFLRYKNSNKRKNIIKYISDFHKKQSTELSHSIDKWLNRDI